MLRHDDPGNMCYGATGKILLSGFNHILEKWALQQFANIYAFGEQPEFKHLADNPEELLEAYVENFKLSNLINPSDDKWDLATIGYGYDAF